MPLSLHRKPTARDLDALERQFDDVLQHAVASVGRSELTPEKRRARRAEADASDLAFARIYYPRIFTHPFNNAHRYIAGQASGHHLISGFPKSGKSAFTYVGKAIKHIALGRGGIVAVCLRTWDKATFRTQSLTRIISVNELLLYDYEIEVVQNQAGYHIFKTPAGHTHLVAGSVNTGLRTLVDDDFKRIRLGIAEDLYDKETVRSALDNQRVADWIEGEFWRQHEDDALSFVQGNSINDGCPMVLLKKKYPDRHYSFPILDEDGTSNWPERYSDEDLARMKPGSGHEDSIPLDVWHGEFLDDPFEQGEIFQPEDLKTVNVNTLSILASITCIDPSHGESPDACFKAAFTGALLSNHKCVALKVRLRREPYPRFFDYLHVVHETTPAHRVCLFENDFSQWGFAQPYYMAWMERRKAVLPIQMVLASSLKTQYRAADKDSRIMNLVHPHQMGLFLYSSELDGDPEYDLYKKQVLAFGGHGKRKLDGPDAAATFYIKIRQYVGMGEISTVGAPRAPAPDWTRQGWFQ